MRSWSFRLVTLVLLASCACAGSAGVIGEIKKNCADGTEVGLYGIVTADLCSSGCDPCAYFEDEDRSTGIKVCGLGGYEGILYAISGILRTDTSGERYIEWVPGPVLGIPSEPARPLGLKGTCVGGGGSNGQPGTCGCCGLNSVGLLVRIHGRVTSADHLNAHFYICDGACRKDGSGCKGIRVSYCDWPAGGPYMTPKSAKLGDPECKGDYVAVTGVCSCVKIAGCVQPVIRTRRPSDIKWFYYGSGW